MKKTDIYVGLNDQDTKVQKFETEKYVSVLKRLCIAYKVPFSFSLIDGGYIHDSGEYTQEKTLVLTLIDADKNIIEEIAKDLCVFFHQEATTSVFFWLSGALNNFPKRKKPDAKKKNGTAQGVSPHRLPIPV